MNEPYGFIGARIVTIQRAALLNVEALEGGYVVQTNETHGDGTSTNRRGIAPNLDALVSIIQGWAARYHADAK